MNIVSVVISASLMGLIAPGVAQMAIQPAIAQKRANNFSEAEMIVVAFAGEAEATQALPDIPRGCSVPEPENSVYSITCTRGEPKFSATVTRAFRILDQVDDGGSGGRSFDFPPPIRFSGTECHTWQDWGTGTLSYVEGAWRSASCNPPETRSRAAYIASHPDNWLYDINNHNGWGDHPDY